MNEVRMLILVVVLSVLVFMFISLVLGDEDGIRKVRIPSRMVVQVLHQNHARFSCFPISPKLTDIAARYMHGETGYQRICMRIVP
jgi:hypothetical protein